ASRQPKSEVMPFGRRLAEERPDGPDDVDRDSPGRPTPSPAEQEQDGFGPSRAAPSHTFWLGSAWNLGARAIAETHPAHDREGCLRGGSSNVQREEPGPSVKGRGQR